LLLNDVHHRMTTQVVAALGGSARLDEWAVLADQIGHPMSQLPN
jgi:hypothetical protein